MHTIQRRVPTFVFEGKVWSKEDGGNCVRWSREFKGWRARKVIAETTDASGSQVVTVEGHGPYGYDREGKIKIGPDGQMMGDVYDITYYPMDIPST